MVRTSGTHNLDHDALSVRNRERVGLRAGAAFVVVSGNDVVTVSEPSLGNRTVARHADTVLDIHQGPVGRNLEGDFHGLLAVALNRSRHERTVITAVGSGGNLQLDTVLLEFVVAVLVALDLGAVEIPAVEKACRIVLRIASVTSSS